MRRKDSIRLRGFDYSEAGSYFITMCTKNRACVFGEIVNGKMKLSEVGKIVEMCWTAIPKHFTFTKVGVFQIMPNHMHGIVEIKNIEKPVGVEYVQPQNKDRSGRGVQLNAPTKNRRSDISPKSESLGVIIRTFKAAVTTEMRKRGQFKIERLWQRNYYDHIIRDDKNRFFVQQYIELNPLLWYLDSNNPSVRRLPIDDFRKVLHGKHSLSGFVVERIIEHE
jgi:REP element-mobilizing transposase RayT